MIFKYIVRFLLVGILTIGSNFVTGEKIYADVNTNEDVGMELFKDTSLNLDDFIDVGDNPIDADDFLNLELNIKGAEEENLEEEKSEEDKPEEGNIKENKETNPKDATSVYIPEQDKWKLILVNKQNPVPEDYQTRLVNVGNMEVDERIAKDTARMLKAAKADGVDLVICSAYRSYDKQSSLFNRKINKYMASNMNYMEAYSQAAFSVTVPGTSEHQLGLALDIVTPSYTSLNEGFADTEAAKWLYENCMEYGFIMRYPKGKENITGIIFEPWHFRYVGKKYAKEISDMEITLEEYLEYIGLK